MTQEINEKESLEVIDNGRQFDRWIVNLAEFFQNEKIQLIRLKKLQKDSQDWNYQLDDPEYEKLIDDQLYDVYRSTISKEVLAKHHLTWKREDFDDILYIDPELLARFQMMDDNYISCYVF